MLVLAMVFGMSTSVFAGEAEPNKIGMVESIASGAIQAGDMVEPNNDRFKYHYETTDAKKVSTAYISEDEVKKMSKVKDISLKALSAAGVLGFGTSFAIEVAEFIYGEQKAGRIEYWKATKKKIKTNVVTGNTSVVGEWWTVTAKCYDTAGKLYGTKTATYKVK